MAYDEGLAERIRGILRDRRDVSEKKMFGGIAFMVRGHMSVGIVKDDLMVRAGPETYEDLVRQPHARPMDFTGRPMKGFVYVASAGFEEDEDLERWVGHGLKYAMSLSRKTVSGRRAPPSKRRKRTRRQMAGYSGTPLAKKLGIVADSRVFLSDAPKNYMELVAPLPQGVRVMRKIDGVTDIVHIFSTERARLKVSLRNSLGELRQDASIWVSWPKKSSKVPTDITEDTIREMALPMGLVDIKVCAVDEVWSGLKLVVRKENRRGRS